MRRWSSYGFGLLLMPVAILTVAACLGRFPYFLELATHFCLMYFVAATALTAIFLVLRAWRWAVFGAVVMALSGAPILPYYWPHKIPDAPANLRVLVSNVLMSNRQYGRLLSLVDSERPDVLVLVEVDSPWMQKLSALQNTYPYRIAEPRGDTKGIAVFSKIPFTQQATFELGHTDSPAISAQFSVASRPLTIFALHACAPDDSRKTPVRDEQLRAAAEFSRRCRNLILTCGDFNTTPWSPAFRDVVNRSGLRDTRLGFGNQGTWPTKYSPVLIPLDHCLVSPEIGVKSFKALPSIGSDHLPILIDLSVPASPTTQ
jgi:endonuclease/exonuclease/phosphatase (EEP) superfamily protein YafD